jgi:hypothetical protein
MSIRRRAMMQAALISTLGLLAGCYQTHVRLFDSGLDAGLLSGQYDCTVPGNQGTSRISLVRLNAGPADIVYAYKYDDPLKGFNAIARLGKLKSGQDLIQIEGLARGMSDYSFVTIENPKSFAIWLPGVDASRRAESFGLGIKIDGRVPSSAELTGSQRATVAFLESFKPDDLAVAFVCRHYDT